jgi:hypothetical protein
MLLVYVMGLERLRTSGLTELAFKFSISFTKQIATEMELFQKSSDPIQSLTAVLFKVASINA